MSDEANARLASAVERMRCCDGLGPDWAPLLYHPDVDPLMVEDVALIVRAYLSESEA